MLEPVRFRLAPADRERYGGDEWLLFHVGLFADHPLSTLRRWEAVTEEQLGLKLFALIRGDQPLREMEPLAVVVWLALQLNKPDAVAFEDFDPRLLAVEQHKVSVSAPGGGAVPPSTSSAATSAETPSRGGRKSSRRKRGSTG